MIDAAVYCGYSPLNTVILPDEVLPRNGTTVGDLHLYTSVISGIFVPREFTLSAQLEQGIWYLILEPTASVSALADVS